MRDATWTQALDVTKKLNTLEERLAMEMYGIPYEELDEDERGEVAFEAYDRLED